MAEQNNHDDILNNLNSQGWALRQERRVPPEVYRGFGELSRAALASRPGSES